MTTTTTAAPDRVASVLRLLADRMHRLSEADRLTLARAAEDALARTLPDDGETR